MPLILPGNVASATASTTYDVANSCRFNAADSAYMQWTPTDSAGTDGQIYTLSFWLKRGLFAARTVLSYATPQSQIQFESDVWNAHGFKDGGTTWYETKTTAKYSDPSAWYHFVTAVDTTQGTEANRVKVYVNGVQITSFADVGYPTEDQNTLFFTDIVHAIGRYEYGDSSYFDGYLAEFIGIDGTQYAASDFGEFDSDSPTIWKPKDISGLTFGNAGFYLSYSDSADLGADSSGNSNDFTVNNLDATDQAIDTPTNNFAVMNPLDNFYAAATITEGNCKISSDRYGFNTSTFALTKGKWYAEFKIVSFTGASVGITSVPADATNDEFGGNGGTGPGFALYHEGGVYGNVGVLVASGGYDSFSNNDIIGCALDLTNNRLYFANNGTWQGSSDPTDGTNALSITAPASTRDGHYFFAIASETGNTAVWEVNFGGCPAFTVSSGNADADGYGNFEYAPPSGYYALCTKNLAEYG